MRPTRSRLTSLLLAGLALARCTPEPALVEVDAGVSDAPPALDAAAPDVSPAVDAPAMIDVRVALDAPVSADAPAATPDVLAEPGSEPYAGAGTRVVVDPAAPVAPAAMTLHLYGPDGWTNLDVALRSTAGTARTPQWIGVTEHFHWRWSVAPTSPGSYCVAVRTDPASTLRWRGPLRITGAAPSPDAGPPADAATPPAEVFVTRRGGELMVGAERLRFIGMNLRAIAHVGTAILPYANVAQIETELAAAERAGARVVRVFAAAHDADAATVAVRLGPVLDAAPSIAPT